MTSSPLFDGSGEVVARFVNSLVGITQLPLRSMTARSFQFIIIFFFVNQLAQSVENVWPGKSGGPAVSRWMGQLQIPLRRPAVVTDSFGGSRDTPAAILILCDDLKNLRGLSKREAHRDTVP